MKKRIISLLSSAIMLFSLLPTTAMAGGGIAYIERSWNGSEVTASEKTCTSYSVVSSGSKTWNAGWYVVNANTTISSAITVSGDVHLILCDDVTLTAQKGIVVNGKGNNSLTIYGQSGDSGKLVATGATGYPLGAGIGGVSGDIYQNACGTVIIHGGTVSATGEDYGCAGIGGVSSNVGTVTVYGGKVTATGKSHGAGIGGTVTVYGGEVTANGNYDAGINGGNNTVTIFGGTIKATSNDGESIRGEVTVNGGAVTAISNGGTEGTGIGGSALTVNGGTVTATGKNYGAGISSSAVTVNGGKVTATGGEWGPGISGGTLTVTDGEVIATGRDNYAGIASAVTVNGGKVTAVGGNNSSPAGISGDVSFGEDFVGGVRAGASENEAVNMTKQAYTEDHSAHYVTMPVDAPTVATIVGTETSYDSVQAAIDAADDSQTVRMEKDVTENLSVAGGKSITLDLNGKVLTGNGNGSVVVVNGTLTLADSAPAAMHDNESLPAGGVITGGTGSYVEDIVAGISGGGVLVNGSFTMTGGTITGNSARYGGGVYVSYKAGFTMTGGTITGNTVFESGEFGAEPAGGGVYFKTTGFSNFVTLGGTAKIIENSGSNLYLGDDSAIQIRECGDNAPAQGMLVGVTTENGPYEGTPVTFAADALSTDAKYFFADNESYAVDLGYDYEVCSEGCLQLVVPQAEDYYPVWIGGTQISRFNKDDVLYDGGTVSFAPETNTLTLNRAAICTGAEHTTDDAIYCNLPADKTLTINLIGSNVIGKAPSAEWENFNIASGISSKEGAKLLLKGDEESSLTIYAGESGIKGIDICLGEEGENFEGKLKIYSLKTGIQAGEEPAEGEITIYGGDIDIKSKENGLYAGGDVAAYGSKIKIDAGGNGILSESNIELSDVTLNVTTNNDSEGECFAIHPEFGLNITGSAFRIVARSQPKYVLPERAIFCTSVTTPEGTKVFGSTEWDASEESITSVAEYTTDDYTFKIGDDFASAVILHICSVEQKPGQAATCTEDGWKEYYQCTDTSCNKIYASTDTAGTSYDNLDEWKTSETGKIAKLGHAWGYNASGATLTATCERNASHTAALTLTASSAVYSGSAVTASYDDGEAAAWKTAIGSDAPTITYEKKGADSTWSAIASAPSAAGEYRAVAKVTKDSTDYTAHKEFTISKAEISSVAFTEPTVAAAGTPETAAGLAIVSEANYTGAISWAPADTTFGYNKVYTATVTLSAKDNYKFADEVTVPTGWTKATSSTDTSLVLTKTYDATAKAKITSVTAPGVTTQLTEFTTKDAQLTALAEEASTVAVTVEDSSVTSMAITWALKSGETYSNAPEAENTFVWTIPSTEYANYDTNSKNLTGEIKIKNPAHTHGNGVKQDGQAATCTEAGYKDYYQCSCGTYFEEKECTTEITDVATWKTTGAGKIAALGHDWRYNADGPTLTATCNRDASHTATLTLTANSANYSGSAVEATMDKTAWEAAGLPAPTVVYEAKTGSALTDGKAVNAGSYTAKITVEGKTATKDFEITKASQEVPATGVGYTINYTDETITAGTDYEVSTSNTSFVAPTDGKVVPGNTYYVRKKGNDNYNPSSWTSITVAARPTAPSGYTAVDPTIVGGANGIITGVTTAMEYSTNNGTSWTAVSGTEITGLSAGKVLLRVKATSSAFASTNVEIALSNPHAHAIDVTKKHVAVPSTCKTKGTKEWYECTDSSCDKKLDKNGNELTSIELDFDSSNHEGTATWTKTATTHKETYNCCGAVKTAENSHISSGAATEESAEVCTVCGYELAEKLPHTHKYATAYSKDATGHWYAATCGHDVKDGFAAHTSSGAATEDAAEVCTVCGYEIAPKLNHNHTYATTYSKDATGHWHAATCGHNVQGSFSVHTYGDWTVTKLATITETGEKQRTCSVCGYKEAVATTYDKSVGDTDVDPNAGKIENKTDSSKNGCAANVEITKSEIIEKLELTPEELSRVENGEDIAFYLVVTIEESINISQYEQKEAEKKLESGEKIGQYLDINLFKIVGNDKIKVSQTNGKIKIQIKIPSDILKVGTDFFIIRVHNGVATKLALTLVSGDTYSFETDQFSTYAIGYKEKSSDSNNDNNSNNNTNDSDNKTEVTVPKTGDPNDLRGWFFALIALLGGVLVLGGLKRKEKASK